MSTFGLDGVLPWSQAHHIAGHCAGALPGTAARLDEAVGAVTSRPLHTLADNPPTDIAATNGYATCGPGPWQLHTTLRLLPGQACSVRMGDPLPEHTDAVLALAGSVAHTSVNGHVHVTACDALSGVPDESLRPDIGAAIIRAGAHGASGAHLLEAGTVLTPAAVALAAAAGHDHIDIVRPPVVGVLVLGHSLLAHGLPRDGRVRDALGPIIPAFVAAHGGRGNPALRAPDTRELLLSEIDDANVDVLITTGSTAPEPGNHVRAVLSDLGARWLIDGVAVTPGAQMLLAKLPDGRFLVGLPGDPSAAIAGLVTLVAPLLRTLSGHAELTYPTAVLIDDAPAADYADDTRLAPVHLAVRDGVRLLRPLDEQGPARLTGWALADHIAVIPPGAGYRGDTVQIIATR